MTATPTRDECLDEAAQVYAAGLAEVAAMTPEDAARAAGWTTEADIARVAADIRASRTQTAAGAA